MTPVPPEDFEDGDIILYYFSTTGKWKYEGLLKPSDPGHQRQLFQFCNPSNLKLLTSEIHGLPGITCKEWDGPVALYGPWGFPHLLPKGIHPTQ